MATATTHVLLALYAHSHRIGLTAGDVAELDRAAPCLSPALWQATKELLVDADRGPDGTTLDLGFLPLVLRWLGLADEDAFVAEFGVGVAEAIEHDRGRLAEIAGALESPGAPGSEELGVHVTVAWARRGIVLMQARPQAASAAVEALERAVAHYPREDAQYRQLLERLLLASEASGDRARQAIVHRQLQTVDRDAESRGEPPVVHSATALVLSILWCIAHDEFLLDAERGLEPWVRASPEAWTQVRASVEADDVDGVPIPFRTYVAWIADERVDSEGLRRCLEASAGAGLLAEMAREVERLWGGPPGEPRTSSPAASHVQAAARLRRARLEQTWVPLPGERQNVFHEVHQGARRPATLQRVELIHRLHALFLRDSPDDPIAVASVWLDRAAECESRGEHEHERVALTRAVELMRDEDPAVREHAEVCSASWLWRNADVDAARGRLVRLEGPQARDLLARIEAREPEREALRNAERLVGQGGLESSCTVALAHLRSGHSTRGEQLARELCRGHPDEGLAWMTLARLLYEHGRYRDAVGPALRALDIGAGVAGQVLLARIFSRMGPDGRAQGGAVALAAIEAHPTEAQLEREELADLVRIAEDGGALLSACRRGDAHVSSLGPDGDAPREWLGEATARRWHGVPAPDAPAWLAHLAAAGREAPAELARFVVERFEALQYWRLLVGRSLFGSVPDLETERRLYSRARAYGEGVHELSIEAAVAEGVGRAGASLGWAPSAEPVEPAVHWEPHFPVIQSVFGVHGAVRLRASERAQAVFFSELEIAESERLVVLATFEAERFFWARWLAEQELLQDLALGRQDGCSAGTLARLLPILELAADGSFAAVSSGAWATRWHDAERR